MTGTDYEPWYYRYVGLEVAEKVFEDKIYLEEYFE
ncbi:MAG: hypothetical protein K2K56_10580 [Lachnospiraceae bacterium]|nr:hypothetical protein [Lachnospiraceae bacterium]